MDLAYSNCSAVRIDTQGIRPSTECVINEVAVALVFNGISHAVMMASPSDLDDFALGFALAEGIIAKPQDIRSIDQQISAKGISLNIEISPRRMQGLQERRRSLLGRSSCGLCGVESLDQALRAIPKVSAEYSISAAQIHAGLLRMSAAQRLNAATGAAHAAAWITVNTDNILLREDIGRHNALDKLIGARARSTAEPGVLLISSRASYEMLHKAAMANMPLLAAISAPSALAIKVASEAGITLIGFARGDGLTCYSQGRGRLQGVDLAS